MKRGLFIGVFAVMAGGAAYAQEPASAPAENTSVVAEAPAVSPAVRELVLSADGRRIGRVDRVGEDGSPRVIFQGRMVSIPIATLSRTDEGLVTSLTRREVMDLD